jgi:hypothetical protein
VKTTEDTTTKLYIGFDVQKEKTPLAHADPGANGGIRSFGEVATSRITLERSLRSDASHTGPLIPPSGGSLRAVTGASVFLAPPGLREGTLWTTFRKSQKQQIHNSHRVMEKNAYTV